MGQENQNKYKPVNRSQIVQHRLQRRTAAALKQHRAFALEHQQDSREELVAYVRQCAEELGRTPAPEDVIGSPFLSSRFEGGWAGLIQEAGLPPLPGKPVCEVKADRASEYERQLQLHRRKKAAKRAKYEARMKKSGQRESTAPNLPASLTTE